MLTQTQAPAAQSLAVFTSVVVIIAVGSLVVTVQAKVEKLHFPFITDLTSAYSSLVVECMH